MIRGSRPQPVPPAPTELLLVTRMGDNNSPILLTDVPQPIATFNKPFELSELVGNLDGVMYLYSGEAVNVTCVSYEETGQTKYALAYNNGQNRIAELTVEGSTLLCTTSNTGNYLFDLDFKHQNRNFFEQTNGTYAVSLPWLGLDAESKVLVSVSGESSSKTVTIHYVDNDYRAWGYAGNAIREISWFNQLLTSSNITSIVALVEKLINLEYSPEAAGGISVVSVNTQPSTVTGTWNLFTDGSPFIPLRILSRFPNGSPVQSENQQKTIATFNRAFNFNELWDNYKLKGVAWIDGLGVKELTVENGIDDIDWALCYIDEGDSYAIASLSSSGQNLVANFINELDFVYDIDFDHQFRRSVPTGVTKMNVQLPQLLGNPSTNQGVAIVTDSESPDQLYVIANNDNKRPYICQGDTVQNQLGEWAYNISYANVSRLLQAIMTMEFTGYDEIPVNVQDTPYKESSASGYVVTPLIPQTLS